MSEEKWIKNVTGCQVAYGCHGGRHNGGQMSDTLAVFLETSIFYLNKILT